MNNTGVQMEYEKAIDYIFGMIKNGDLTVGSKLPTERAIAQELNIGRNSTREALSILHGMGMVKSVQGCGNYICADSNKTIFQILTVMLALGSITKKDVCEFRRAMEKTVCMLLLEKSISEDADKKMKSLLDDMKKDQPVSGSSSECGIESDLQERYENPAVRSDKEFHALLVTATHNELLSTIMGAVMTVYQEWIELVLKKADPETKNSLVSYHEDIYNGIKAKNEGLVNEAIDKHYNLIEELLIV